MKLKILWVILTLFIILLTFFFGLRPKGFNFINNAKWIVSEPGIRFDTYGIVYKVLNRYQFNRDFNGLDTFSVEILFKPENFEQRGFSHILSIHDGEDNDQLLIGQWKAYLIVMNGDDYSNKRKIKRITYKIDSDIPMTFSPRFQWTIY